MFNFVQVAIAWLELAKVCKGDMAEQTGRSLRLTAEQQANANTALSKFGSKRDLAADLKMSPTTITNFFAGRPVQRKEFHLICKKLKLNWQPEPATPPQAAAANADIDELVREVRDRIRSVIQERCGTMRVLDMNQPIELGEIYTHVNILEKITGRARRELAELVQDVSPENFERFSLGAVKETIPGLKAVEKHSKLMILGKPGAGKTTFLKHLAIQCIGGAFQSDRVPLFITLKDFAEADGQPDLMTFIDQAMIATSLPSHNTQQLLDDGRALILLDGLDEVREIDASRVLRQIQQFSERYSRNAFVITCRIAAREYTFQQFTEVEVADFDDDQIAEVSGKWFRCKQDEVKAERFLQQLKDNPPIRDLASSPLLLTLLCLVFEDSGDFPANRAELYQTGVDALLKKWDTKRNIERDQTYKKLSLKRKEDLLSQIAWRTFEPGNYFFKQKDVEQQIREFIENLPGASTDEEALHLDSEAVLKSIEAQHGLFVERARGIYSFSHLTFHEYFAAREAKEQVHLSLLTQNIFNTRWREVILLTVEMLPNADLLLEQTKQAVDNLVTGNKKLQQFLMWVDEKAQSWVDEKAQSEDMLYKPNAVRAFYFNLAIATAQRDFGVAIIGSDYARKPDNYMLMSDQGNDIRNLPYDFDHNFDFDFNLSRDYYLSLTFTLATYLWEHDNSVLVQHLDINLMLEKLVEKVDTSDFKLELELEDIATQLPSFQNNWNLRERWWQKHGKAWMNQLCSIMIKYCNIGHDWQFDDAQIERMQKYYHASKLLLDCLNSDCYISRELRQEIEETFLLPIAALENR